MMAAFAVGLVAVSIGTIVGLICQVFDVKEREEIFTGTKE